MNAKRLIIATVFLLSSLTIVWGQQEKSTFRTYLNKADSIITTRYNKIDYDTNYIQRPQGRFLLKMYGNLSGITITASDRQNIDEDDPTKTYKSSAKFRTTTRSTFSLGLTYQGLTAGITINPSAIGGGKRKKGEVELGLNIYDNRFIFDINYYVSNTFAGYINVEDFPFPIDFHRGDIKIKMLNLSGYYTFNNKRFSFPAAFNQTYVQKKSAGSILAGFSFQGMALKNRENWSWGELISYWKSKLYYVGVGVGYGYNFVFDKGRWLVHASLLPNIVLYNVTKDDVGGEKGKSHDSFPVFLFNQYFAVVHFFGPKVDFFGARYLAGVTCQSNNVLTLSKHASSSQDKWMFRFFIGARF